MRLLLSGGRALLLNLAEARRELLVIMDLMPLELFPSVSARNLWQLAFKKLGHEMPSFSS
jgi:hypothetical protein